MDTPDVIGVYSDAYDGGLGDCATIVDTHVRRAARKPYLCETNGPAGTNV